MVTCRFVVLLPVSFACVSIRSSEVARSRTLLSLQVALVVSPLLSLALVSGGCSEEQPAPQPPAAVRVDAERSPGAMPVEPATQPASESTAGEANANPDSARAKFERIREGVSREEVTALLGKPMKVDPDEPDGTVEIDWDGGVTIENGKPHRVEITINFRDGKVVRKRWDLDPLGGWPAK